MEGELIVNCPARCITGNAVCASNLLRGSESHPLRVSLNGVRFTSHSDRLVCKLFLGLSSLA